MNHTSPRIARLALFVCLLAFDASGLRAAHAQAVTILHSFADGSVPNDGTHCYTVPILGTDGNLYGTTDAGGSAGEGTVYKITPSGTETILHSFGDGSVSKDGSAPGGLVLGRDGNLYGTTSGGGANSSEGTAFKMTPSGTVTILHNFGDHHVTHDGQYPYAPLVQGSDGNLYGTTGGGGSADEGTVFKMTPSGTVTILHSFEDGSVPNDGYSPLGLVEGPDGNFYGTTGEGGSSMHNGGIAYKITPSGTETVLHVFADGTVPDDGYAVSSPLILGTDGNFYGTTLFSLGGEGTVYKLTPSGIKTVVHTFGDPNVPNDGGFPIGLIQGSDGNFYGVAGVGGSAGHGTVYQLTPSGMETILHSFGDGTVANEGTEPNGLVQGSDGSFYGTTQGGGSGGGGTVYRLAIIAALPPTLTGFTPGEGPAYSTVTLTGTNLGNLTAIRFHDASAQQFVANADGTQLTVTVPPGAEKGTITVTNAAGSATTATPFRVTYRPVITAFSPSSGPVGSVMVITGTHLSGITRVRFHNADATVYSSNADGTQLTVTVPTGAASGTITLDNRDVLATTTYDVYFTVTH